MHNVFHFKNFSVAQDNSAMKVGTDGVLLGAWAHGGSRIMDIGAGTGIISLMMAQRFPKALVSGVELDPIAAKEATENVMRSPFAERIKIYQAAIQEFKPECKFDAIVTNPPFYTHGFHTKDSPRRMARQTETLQFADIIKFSKKWLEEDGELSVIIPVESVEEFSSEAFVRGFFIARKYLVSTTQVKKAKRCLLSFSLTRPRLFDYKEVPLQEKDGHRSEWYQELTGDFYIR